MHRILPPATWLPQLAVWRGAALILGLIFFVLISLFWLLSSTALAHSADRAQTDAVLAGGIVINELLPDPNRTVSGEVLGIDADCDGTIESADEFIELFNLSNDVIDISLYEIWDSGGGPRYIFPENTQLSAQSVAAVIFNANDGRLPTVFDNNLVFDGGRSSFLNNSGDHILLYSPTDDAYVIMAYGNGDVTPHANFTDAYPTATRIGSAEHWGSDTDGGSLVRDPDGRSTIAANDTGDATPGALGRGSFRCSTAPLIIGSDPADGAVSVAPSKSLSLTFDQPVTLTLDAVSLVCGGDVVAFSADDGPSTYTLTPITSLPSGATCTLTVASAAAHAHDDGVAFEQAWQISFATGLIGSTHAALYISDESTEREALLYQDDAWRANSRCNNWEIGVLSAESPTSTTIITTTVDLTLVNMDGADLDGTPNGTNGVGSGCSAGTTLQDGAPRPDRTLVEGCYYNDANRGSSSNRNGVAITFSEPVSAFGAWFGDLETKPAGTDYFDPDGSAETYTGSGGASALLRLFFTDGTYQEQTIDATLAPATMWNAEDGAPAPSTTASDGSVAYCGGQTDSFDADGCGNETTRWVGFVTEPNRPLVEKMLVVVGDDDHSGSGPADTVTHPTTPNVVCSDASDCDGGGEFLSLIGPTMCAPAPTATQVATSSAEPPESPIIFLLSLLLFGLTLALLYSRRGVAQLDDELT